MTDSTRPAALVSPSGVDRRDFLRRSLLIGAGVGLAPVLGTQARALAADLDYTSRDTFDKFVRTFETTPGRIGQSTDYNDTAGALAWGQSYVQLSYLRMYEAFRKIAYLDALVDRIDDVLATRDSRRGVVDYRGLSLPAWRADDPYTVGRVVIPDAAGKPVLEVRNLVNDVGTNVSIEPGSAPATFTLRLKHPDVSATDVIPDLSMDPASPRYVVTVLYDAYPSYYYDATARDLRENPPGNVGLQTGTWVSDWAPVIFGVHTGMITNPIASCARMIYETPSLRSNPRYRAKADEYVQACIDALAVHDDEWRENAAGEGWYVFRKGMPTPYDGTEQPANQFLALGRTYAELARITGQKQFVDRVRSMSRTFKNDLKVDAGGAYTWTYWLSWGQMFRGFTQADDVSTTTPSYCCAQQPEDISHAHIDLDFAIKSAHEGLIFTGHDMDRFARTFTQNIAYEKDGGLPSAHVNVDGTGAGSLSWELLSSLWMPIAPRDHDVLQHVLDVYNETARIQPDYLPSGYIVNGVANIAWMAKLLK